MSHLILIFISGAIASLAFSYDNLFFLNILCPLALIYCLNICKTNKKACLIGFIYGFGYFGVGVSWIYVSFKISDINCFLSILLTLFFISILSLFKVAFGFIFFFVKNFRETFLRKNIFFINYIFIFPAIWVLIEWLQASLFTGFPWLIVGISQVKSPLIYYADVIGEYGITYLTIMCSGLLFLCLTVKLYRYWFFLFFILFSGFFFKKDSSFTKFSNNIYVTLIQANVAQNLKWDDKEVIKSIKKYEDLTVKNLISSKKQQLFIWPETAIPMFIEDAKPWMVNFLKKMNKRNVGIISGIPIIENNKYYNAITSFLLAKGNYYKRKLVPFGEYVPFENFFGRFFDFLNVPMSDFTSGSYRNSNKIYAFHFVIAPFICYEIAYENLVLKDAQNSDILMTLSDDAWFGKTFAPIQHLQIEKFRAIETNKYHVVVNNTGPTGIINNFGNLVVISDIFKEDVVNGFVYANNKSTYITKIGNKPIIVGIILSLLFIFI